MWYWKIALQDTKTASVSSVLSCTLFIKDYINWADTRDSKLLSLSHGMCIVFTLFSWSLTFYKPILSLRVTLKYILKILSFVIPINRILINNPNMYCILFIVCYITVYYRVMQFVVHEMLFSLVCLNKQRFFSCQKRTSLYFQMD